MVLESPADSDDLFNLELVPVAMVDGVSYSCKGGHKGSINCVVVGEWDGHLSPPEYLCLNRGTNMSG